MPINLKDEQQRKREVAEQIRLQILFEQRLTARIRGVFTGVAREAAKDVEHGGRGENLDKIAHRLHTELYQVFVAFYGNIIKVFGSRIFEALKLKGYDARLQQKDVRSIFERYYKAWIADNALRKSTTITDTTKKIMAKIIHAGASENLSSREIARNIRHELTGDNASARANMIARTETHTAALFSGLIAAKISRDELGLNMSKEWISAEDNRVRWWHGSPDGIDGTIIKLDEFFQVPNPKGGVNIMDGPGDTTAPPEQVINCRCVLGYIVNE